MSAAAIPTAKLDRPQLDQLTGLRGLAAWFVVFYHIRESLTGIMLGEAIDVLSKGYLAVDLFFMLSGFVMWLSYGERFRREGVAQAAPFLWKRFARIWPLHAVILAGFAAFVVLLAVTGRSTMGYPVHELPMHILLIQNWGFTGELTWNHPAWSISTEFAAYLLFPALAIGIKWERMSSALLIAVLVGLALALHGWFALGGYTYLGEDIAQTGLMRCLIEFSMGIALANLWRASQGNGRAGLAAWIVAALVAIIASVFDLGETIWVPAFIAAILLAMALNSGPVTRIFASRPLVAVGDWSYATYLSHFLLFILFKIMFVGEDLQVGWAGLVAFTALVLAASVILYHGCEKPSQSWINARRPGFLRSARR